MCPVLECAGRISMTGVEESSGVAGALAEVSEGGEGSEGVGQHRAQHQPRQQQQSHDGACRPQQSIYPHPRHTHTDRQLSKESWADQLVHGGEGSPPAQRRGSWAEHRSSHW